MVLTMLVCGAGLGLLYDLGRGLWRLCRGGRLMEGVLDLGFGVLFALTVSAAALHLRTNPFRLFVLLGTAAGGGLYAGTLGLLFRRRGAKKVRGTEQN